MNLFLSTVSRRWDGQPFHSIVSPFILFLIVFHELWRSVLVINWSVFYNFLVINISGYSFISETCCFYHTEIFQLICTTNQLTDFYMIGPIDLRKSELFRKDYWPWSHWNFSYFFPWTTSQEIRFNVLASGNWILIRQSLQEIPFLSLVVQLTWWLKHFLLVARIIRGSKKKLHYLQKVNIRCA